MPMLALTPTTFKIRSIGTEPQRRELICWFCMALVLTERHQGVTCAHIRAHMPMLREFDVFVHSEALL